MVKVIAMGRRWGKTFMAGDLSISCACNGAAVAWIVPTYKNARPVWRFAERMIAPVSKLLRVNKTERVMEFPNGGYLGIYTADNPVGILGEAFDIAIIEEAARVSEDVWTETVMPTLADRNGRAMLISTPKGRNWFWREFERGKADGKHQAAFTAPSSANPMPSIRAAALMAKARVSDRTWRQEWGAEFVEDGAGVFRNIRALSSLPRLPLRDGAEYLIGVDWGRRSDASVFSVWDIGAKQEVALHRLPVVTYGAQIAELKRIADEYRDALVIAESNGMGDPLIEQAAQAGIRIMQFVTTAATKAHGVDALALACENGRAEFQADETGILEMESFESIGTTINGLPRYSAPQGAHDDIVMARVIAYSGLAQSQPVLLWE